MKHKILSMIRGDGMKARAIRGTAVSLVGFGGAQVIRLASNLILTRLLFPEVFGLMTLVTVFLVGLQMFSDTGMHEAIVQSKRGDDPDFLNTVWTINIVRGVILWLVACGLAVPVAAFYEQEMLASLLPVLGLTTLISGFDSTRLASANRHLIFGRLTVVELGSQILATVIMILLAFWFRSVWALAFGVLAGSVLKTALSHLILPGPPNRISWDSTAFSEIFHFGKYLFFGTIAGFFVLHGDRLILGKFITLEELAIYSIALMMAMVPQALDGQLKNRVLLPLFRKKPPIESDANWQNIGRARGLIIGGLMVITAILAFGGELIIELLYDPRYYKAGPLLVLISLSLLPGIFMSGYNGILLANGNSRHFTALVFVLAVIRTTILLYLVTRFGLAGAILAAVIAEPLIHPLRVMFIRPYRGWYPAQDLGFGLLALAIAAGALWNSPAARELLAQALQ